MIAAILKNQLHIRKKEQLEMRQYFIDARDEIAKTNLSTIQIASIIGIFLLLIFFFITPFMIKSWRITWDYLLILPPLFLLLYFTIWYRMQNKIHYFTVQIVCILFCFIMMAYFIELSVFPYPNNPESLFTICIMFIPVLFILKSKVITSILFFGEIVFIILIFTFKSTQAYEHDLFTTVAALMFSKIVFFITNRLRVRDYIARMKFKKLSMTDSLTELLNKTTFEQSCQDYLQMRCKADLCTLFVIDLDNFKHINDTMGHKIGDELLKLMGECLKEVSSENDIIGRIGGDEFCVLAQHISKPSRIERRALEFLSRFEERSLTQIGVSAKCSIGIAISDEETDSYLPFFNKADNAMYKAKETQKGYFYVYS